MKQKNKVARKSLLKKNNLAIIISSSILAMSLTAGTCGTFAWFTYATRAYVNYEGVTIGSGSLEVGFAPEYAFVNYANYGLHKETTESGKEIYWSDTKEITSETMQYVLESMGYATTSMNPVSSGSYYYGDTDFSLYSAPKLCEAMPGPADHKMYIFLPLVFRYEDEIDPGVYLSGFNVYLTKADVKSETSIHNSIRIHTFSNEVDHLMNPTSNVDGSTIVGGVLDLNGDGYYDTYELSDENYEVLYGEFEGEGKHKDTPEEHDSDVPETERTTFKARHKAETYAIDAVKSTPDTADYEGMSKFKNMITPIGVTNSETDNYAYVDFTGFIEGWDLSVIEAEKDNPFEMELKFEVEL